MRKTIKKPGIFLMTRGRALAVLIFGLATVISVAASGGDRDSALLRPLDTSSPRDTLYGFLSDLNQIIEDLGQDRRDGSTYGAYRRAVQALDFSATPEGDTWFVRTERMALLYELLARIEVPPKKEIPGDADVASGAITQWTIPGTRLTIAKVLAGPRAGQFLFSADTVQILDGLYRQAKDLPYRPGARPDLYEQLVGVASKVMSQEQEIRKRLKPVDTSSPRASLDAFLANVNQSYGLVQEARAALQAAPPTMTLKEAREAEAEALRFLHRAGDTLDLSEVPKALRRALRIEAVLQLKEVFDRALLPPMDTVPDARMVDAARRAWDGPEQSGVRPVRWRLPNTTIEIVEILEGDRTGEFLFSANTVRRIGNVYGKIKDLPYRPAEFGGIEREYLSPGLSPGFYASYFQSSGHLLPQAHRLGRLVEVLPAWFKTAYAGQLLWQWVGFFLCVLLTAFTAYAAHRAIRRTATRLTSPAHDWIRVLAPIVVLLIVMMVTGFIGDNLNFTGDLQVLFTRTVAMVFFVLTAWVVFVFFQALAETIVATPRLQKMNSEAALLRMGARVVGFLIAVWILVEGIGRLGADLLPLLAGLGIGGFAVALGAQSTIANFIGGLILLANKPVRVGDFCRYGEDPSGDWLRIGTVEEIGWMSTRIRGIDRTVTTIPNASLSNIHIVNFSQRDQRLFRTTLQLRYETTPEQMHHILSRLRELLLGHPMVAPEPARVRFVDFGAYSKDVEIFCYLRCTEQSEFLAIKEELLLRMENVVREAGSGFAFPSQTTYFARDSGLAAKGR